MWDFIKGLWPRSPFTWLGLILGAMSVLKLIEFGFNYGFGPTFTLMLSYYETFFHAVIGWWAEPIVKEWLADLSAYFGWDLRLYPHWKHVLVLLSIFFLRAAIYDFRAGPGTGMFAALSGFVIGLGASVAAGTIALAKGDLWTNFLIAGIPIASIILCNVIGILWTATFLRELEAQSYRRKAVSWWAYRRLLYSELRAGLLGITLLFAALQVHVVQSLPSPGLTILGTLVVARALWYLRLGARQAELLREQGEPWSKAYWRSGGAIVGIGVLGVFFWTTLFIAANAGLRFYGL